MLKKQLIYLFMFLPFLLQAQIVRNVLFLGNSYTGVNNLPQLVSNIAESRGDALTFQSYVPGGFTLQMHLASSFSTGRIMNGNWDYVVLQDQSQLPSFETYDTFPADSLCSMNAKYNPCGRTMFYMTWGRKNGDATNCAAWPPVCTYIGMDSLLTMRYMEMAIQNHAELSPVAVVWRYIRQHYPSIELYWPDGSHPSAAGSYIAACCFYTMMFKKDPVPATYTAGLSVTDAAIIRQAVKDLVFDHFASWDFTETEPHVDFTYLPGNQAREFIFTNISANAESYLWNFGDGNMSADTNAVHTYTSDAVYTVTLTGTNCDVLGMNQQSKQIMIDLNPIIPSPTIMIYPNPTRGFFTVKLPTASIGMNYRIVDALGRIVQKGSLTRELNDFNFDRPGSGIYIFQAGNITMKILKY